LTRSAWSAIGDTVSRDSKRAKRVSTVIVTRLQERAVGRLVIESRQDDRADERTIHAARRPQPRLVFEHRISAGEPMLWLADPVAWTVGAGELWLERVESVLSVVVELRP